MIRIHMPRTALPRQAEPSQYGTRQLASAIGISRIALGSILAANYVTTSVTADGPGHPRSFTIIDAWQCAIFCRLYGHWPRSVVTLGWLVDTLLDRDEIEFETWAQTPGTPARRPRVIPSREDVIGRIELLDRDPTSRPVWYRHRDLSTPFHILVTN